jgi:hypothetical protein
MLATREIVLPAEFRPEPDLSESYSRVVEASAPTVQAAVGRFDLVGPLVEGLIAIGVAEHVGTPCSDGLVWRFGGSESGRVKIAWHISVAPETDETSLVTLSLQATASDERSRERLYEAWTVLGPVAELHAKRVLHRIESLAEETAEDPFEAPGARQLHAIS